MTRSFLLVAVALLGSLSARGDDPAFSSPDNVEVQIDPLAEAELRRMQAGLDRERGRLRLPGGEIITYKNPGTKTFQIMRIGDGEIMIRVEDIDGSQTIAYHRGGQLEAPITLKPGETVPVDVVVHPDARSVMSATGIELDLQANRVTLSRQAGAKIEFGLPGTRQVSFKKTGPAEITLHSIDTDGSEGFITISEGRVTGQKSVPPPK